MEFGLLGPLQVRIGETRVEIGAAKQRALLIQLLLRVGETVPIDRLIDALWDEDPPPQSRVTLRSYVSNLRRLLDDAAHGQVIVTRGNGYVLEVGPEAVDAVRFAGLVGEARDAFAGGDATAALAGLNEALGLWRGEALADVANSPFATGQSARLEEERLSAREDRHASATRCLAEAHKLAAVNGEQLPPDQLHGLQSQLATRVMADGDDVDSE